MVTNFFTSSVISNGAEENQCLNVRDKFRFTPRHTPVMVKEVFNFLIPETQSDEGGLIVDATVGLGGHLAYLSQNSSRQFTFLGIDIDPDAVAYSRERFKDADNVIIQEGNYVELPEMIRKIGFDYISGVLFDFGIGRFQLEALENRGFSFLREAPLDMRFAQKGQTALDLLRTISLRELERILRDYGNEPHYRKVARVIMEKRRQIKTTRDLREILFAIAPKGKRIKTCQRVFLSLRIAVNQELVNLRQGIEKVMPILKEKGRMVTISYHSGEDRIIKEIFRGKEKEKVIMILTPKPIRPTNDEILKNPQARSAKLRAIEKIKREI